MIMLKGRTTSQRNFFLKAFRFYIAELSALKMENKLLEIINAHQIFITGEQGDYEPNIADSPKSLSKV